jgi:gluconate 2-dehydrogenase gamma chain
MKSKVVDSQSRRQILKAFSLVLPASALVDLQDSAAAATPDNSATDSSAASSSTHQAWQYFNADEAALVDAIVSRLIPADELGPGAREANVAVYIDRQLAGAWGAGDQFYKSGPFRAGTPQQGYQLSYTPAQMFRIGLRRFADVIRAQYGEKAFQDLAASDQDGLLTNMETNKLDFSPLPAGLFFSALLDVTIEGFFADPVYGGNKDMAGWKLIQFPGAYASYSNDIERHGIAFVRAPVSIADGPVHDMRDMPMQKMQVPAAPGRIKESS